MREEERRRSLECSIKDGMAWAVNEGLGAYSVPPFVVALGASEKQIGALTSVPNLVSNLSQLATPKLMEEKSRKKLVTDFILFQAFTWLPMALLALSVFLFGLRNAVLPLLVMVFYTGYLTLGLLVRPAWSSWMGDLVREEERGRFFGRRNRLTGLANLTAVLFAGFFLDAWKGRGHVFLGFAILFLLAMTARLVSWHFLLRQYEPPFKEKREYYFSFTEFLKKIWRRGRRPNRFGRFTLYASLMAFTVNLAAPFFAVYMLRYLHFSYSVYMLIVFASSFARLLSMPWWGKFSDRYGRLTTLRAGGLLIPWVPLLWLLTSNPVHLFTIEMFSGFAWAAFDLASFAFVYDVVSRQRLGVCFSYFNALNGLGTFAGATLGGFLAELNLGFHPILFLFLLSGILRLIVSLVLLPHLKEIRRVPAEKLMHFERSFIRRKFRI
ncbi:MAG: MFS transporter [Hadesarchaea archaeon]|nr:MFS transporter [Hadesarchaea archaeon]